MVIKNTNERLVEIELAARSFALEPGDEMLILPEEVRDATMREHLQVRSVSIVRPTTEDEETAFAASLGLPAVRPDVHDRTE